MVKNLISCISNPSLFQHTLYLEPEILEYKGKKMIHINVPVGSEVHTYKKIIYDRVDDANVKVTATAQIAQMYIRKQEIFTEKRIYPYVKKKDLRMEHFRKFVRWPEIAVMGITHG